MPIDLQRIELIAVLCKQAQIAQDKADEAAMPELKDTSKIKMFYEEFIEFMADRYHRSTISVSKDWLSRSEFVCCMMWLYSPQSFTCKRIAYGLRKALSSVMRTHGQRVSEMMADTLFHYKSNSEYKREVDLALEYLKQFYT